MSLKAFHVVFVLVATVGLVAFGVWALGQDGGTGIAALAYASFAGALAMLVYGRWFLKKLKDVSYL